MLLLGIVFFVVLIFVVFFRFHFVISYVLKNNKNRLVIYWDLVVVKIKIVQMSNLGEFEGIRPFVGLLEKLYGKYSLQGRIIKGKKPDTDSNHQQNIIDEVNATFQVLRYIIKKRMLFDIHMKISFGLENAAITSLVYGVLNIIAGMISAYFTANQGSILLKIKPVYESKQCNILFFCIFRARPGHIMRILSIYRKEVNHN